MIAKFLKRTETEKGETIKIVLEVPAFDTEVFTLKRGQSYEVRPESHNKPEADMTAKDKLETALRLISEVSGIMPEPRKSEPIAKDTCGRCDRWERDEDYKDPMGNCLLQTGVVTHIADECTVKELRDAEEDQGEGLFARQQEEVSGDMDGEERVDSGDPGRNVHEETREEAEV